MGKEACIIEELLRLEGYLTVNTFEESDMVTINTNQVTVEHSPDESTSRNGLSEFAGFLANPRALRRGGPATQAGRCQKRRGLLYRMAQIEVNRLLRAEIEVRGSK